MAERAKGTVLEQGSDERGEVLSRRRGFARVWRCRPGCVHVDLKRFSFRLDEEDLERLAEMLAEARRHLQEAPALGSPGIH